MTDRHITTSHSVGSGMQFSLLGLHAWTGCNSVSAFGNQGMLEAWEVLQQ